eukprot:CAMPEP_0119466010 /NCGR_PEP_ID=MMETSP1344-20130328/867_1 /TAXON_ID=236787 /ORGANISM="Florenciella parvula, Strain CCMP2471" /LENGTH=36 /DNA_ID= /DNA_START= /DNA_END= /DNA_ORIENTATION=
MPPEPRHLVAFTIAGFSTAVCVVTCGAKLLRESRER